MSHLGEDVIDPMAVITIRGSLMFFACDCRVREQCFVNVVNGKDPNFHANSSMIRTASEAGC